MFALPSSARAHDGAFTLGATRTALLVWIADELGYFASTGVKTKLYQSGTQTARDLIDGKVQMATSSEFAFVSNALDDANMRVLAAISSSRTARLISRRDKVGDDVGELAGKRVGVTRKSIGQYFLWQHLMLNGVDPSKVELVDLRPKAIIQALTASTIDAGLTWEPYVYQARKALGDLARGYPGQEAQSFYFLLTAKARWLKNHAKESQAVLAALVKAETFAREDPAAAKSLIAKRFGTDVAFLDYLWPQHTLRVALPQDLISSMESEALWRIEEGLTKVTKVPNMLTFIDTGPLREVKSVAVQIIQE